MVRKQAARLLSASVSLAFAAAASASAPGFYSDVLPILQTHCQNCHRSGAMAPMPLETYAQVAPLADTIATVTASHTMPPWFADPCCGRFSNDPSLTSSQIRVLADWAKAHAPREAGMSVATSAVHWTKGWNIDQPDAVLTMPAAKQLPAAGDVPYQYVILPTGFTSDRWVRMSEIRPGNRMAVHHAVAYIRPPNSPWLRGAPVGKPFIADDLPTESLRRDAMWTASDILLVYAPGSLPDRWPSGFAKLVPAGADIVLQMHYTTHGHATEDRTSVGLVFVKEPPAKRVLTLQLTNDKFSIPPGDPNYKVEVHGSIPNDALLLSFFPHMHLRGKSFEYDLLEGHGRIRTLLRIPHYNFYWQLSYRLAEPITLHAGAVLQAVATFDNSPGNPHNPDPNATVTWGEQTWSEMMVGFFDVAVDPAIDKQSFFVRRR